MALVVPTRQFFFDLFQSSLSRFHGSSITRRKYTFYLAQQEQQQKQYRLNSSSNPNQNPVRKYDKFVRTNQKKGGQFRGDDRNLSGSGDWIEKWNETHLPNRLKQPVAVLDYQTSESESSSRHGNESGGGSTMEKIVEKLKRFGYIGGGESGGRKSVEVETRIEKGSVEDIFYVEEGLLPNPRGGFSKDSDPLGVGEARFPWEKPKEKDEDAATRARNSSRTSLAELTLPESELRRLRFLTFQKKHKTRIGGSGMTQEVVNVIHEKWKSEEIVRLKIEGPPALNMKRMHEILERKTGGLVVWRSGTSLSLYRGVSYEVPVLNLNRRLYKRSDVSSIQTVRREPPRAISEVSSVGKADTALQKIDTEEPPEVQYDAEMDKILDSLGPRYPDWPGTGPLPVDADLLPGLVPDYQPPFRILPYGVRRTLGPKEATSLRRLARVRPPHFALGRSRQLQGLSEAMIKLWEKSSIAKISLKRGVQLTTSERMAEELKRLTGGILLCRNKDFLVFYRGKDFLSPEVTEALLEQQRLATSLQDEEEQARLRASAFIVPQTQVAEPSGTAGTLGETLDAKAKWGKKLDDGHKEKIIQQAEMVRHAELVRKLEKKLAFAERKLMKAEHALSKVEVFLQPADRQSDPESITDEERFMFRKLGLKMKAFLRLGRRGVFDGTVENMHLHWKYRELVKIIINARTFEQVKKVALALEAESGGVLVSVDSVSKKKFAIIVYRGRDYKRPSTLRPKNLLTKRKALAQSIEIQRQQALVQHLSGLQTKVDKLRSELEQMDEIKNRGDELFYDKLDSAYPTSDEDGDDESEEEDDDEAYLDTYENEDDDEGNDLIRNLYEEADLPRHYQSSEFVLNGSLFGDGAAEEEEDNDLHY